MLKSESKITINQIQVGMWKYFTLLSRRKYIFDINMVIIFGFSLIIAIV